MGTNESELMSSLVWGETEGWDQGDLSASAAARAGLNLEAMDKRIVAEEERLETVIERNQIKHEQAGHWGVPTCAFKGQPLFGQDRLDVLLWRLKKEGLHNR